MALLEQVPLHNVTMAQVARASGMSKRTLYEMFADRDALLSATIARIISQIYPPLPPEARDLPLADRLALLLGGSPQRQFTAHSRELLRAIIAGAREFPALARRTNTEGFHNLTRLVAEQLDAARAAGDIALPPDQITAAAELLVAMSSENVMLYLLDPDLPLPTPASFTARQAMAIRLFLDGVRPR